MNEEEKINKSIGERVAIFRKTRQLSRVELSQVIGVTQQQLNKYEKGTNRVSAAKPALISKKFQVDISYFYNDLTKTNLESEKEVRENLNTLISYFLNITKEEKRHLIIALVKAMTE